MLQFGRSDPALDHRRRPTAFGLVLRDGLLACVRVERGAQSYFDLPGGALDGDETEAQALAREFVEETGLDIAPLNRIAEASQFFRRSTDEPVNNVGGYWTADIVSEDPQGKQEADHTLTWLDPTVALSRLRHDAHAWAVAAWMRHVS